ncbi:putative CCR4-associated factor 1 homolog 7 [Wolffia australiana]
MEALGESQFAAIDTEFPGFFYHTSFAAGARNRYRDLQYNVNITKVIQLGLSFFYDDGRHRSWQINFRDFDLSSPSDWRREDSIDLLKRSGIDFTRARREGVDAAVFSRLLKTNNWMQRRKPLWVIHGMYDMGYLVKLLMQAPLPQTLPQFIRLISQCMGRVVDVKHLSTELGESRHGLVHLSESLGVTVHGGAAHQAGTDSLLTGIVYSKMAEKLCGREKLLEGVLWGFENKRIPVPTETQPNSAGMKSARCSRQ